MIRYRAAGRSLEVCRALLQKRSEVVAHFKAACAEFCGHHYVTMDELMIGVCFAPVPISTPPGWKLSRDQRGKFAFHVPDLRTREGKRIAERLAVLPTLPSQWNAWRELGMKGGSELFVGNRIYPRAQIEGGPDEFVIHCYYEGVLPDVPPDAVEMLVSEYEAWRVALNGTRQDQEDER